MLKRAISIVFLATQAHALAAGPRWTPRAKGDAPKFAAPVDEFVERIESAKTAVVGGLAASVAGAAFAGLGPSDGRFAAGALASLARFLSDDRGGTLSVACVRAAMLPAGENFVGDRSARRC